MCHYNPWEEDDLSHSGDRAPRAENHNNPIAVWEARLDMLEARVRRIEAHVEGLQARMLMIQRILRIVCVLFLITLAYALRK